MTVLKKEKLSRELSLLFPSDLEIFKGHFPGFAITPGVVLIHSVVTISKEAFDIQGGLEIPNMKFMSPISPDIKINLNLNWDLKRRVVLFKFYISQKVFAKGDLKFGEDNE